MLTLTGILAFIHVWMFETESYTAIQLTKYNYNCRYSTKTFTNMSTNTSVKSTCQYNTKTFTNMSTNTSVKRTCQYNTKTFTNISTNTSTKSSICVYMDTNKDIEKFL